MTSDTALTTTRPPKLGVLATLPFTVIGDRLTDVGTHGVRYTIAGVLGWIGAMKFTSYEASAIEGLVASSPLTSWLYDVYSLQGASSLFGVIEIAVALLIAIGPWVRVAAVAGALGVIVTRRASEVGARHLTRVLRYPLCGVHRLTGCERESAKGDQQQGSEGCFHVNS